MAARLALRPRFARSGVAAMTMVWGGEFYREMLDPARHFAPLPTDAGALYKAASPRNRAAAWARPLSI
jgi:hypothetical protein